MLLKISFLLPQIFCYSYCICSEVLILKTEMLHEFQNKKNIETIRF